MSRRRSLLAAIVAVSLPLAAAETAPSAPKAPEARPGRAEVLAGARDVMKLAKVGTLITLTESGQPMARTVDASEPDPDFTVWIVTNAVTRKVAQLKRNDRATLHYYDPAGMGQVALLGTATLVTDPAEKERRWRAKWNPFYPGGPRSPEAVLIRFVPRTVEVASEKHKLPNDPKTWQPVILDLR